MLDTTTRTIFSDDHALFRDSVRKLFQRILLPHLDAHEQDGIVGRDFWRQCGDAGLLCPTVEPAYGGVGLDFTYNAIVQEELSYTGSHAGLMIQNDITADYSGVKVVVDPSSAQMLTGATLDYKDGLNQAGFSIDNPNAQRTCGCGSSFS